MKKTTLITTIAGLAIAFGLSACTDAEMAQVERDMDRAAQNAGSMVNAERDCKTYVSGKFDLPMAAVSVSPGYGSNGRYTIPVRIKWDEPRVDESGKCSTVDDRAVSYRASYE